MTRVRLYTRSELTAYLSLYYPDESFSSYTDKELLDITNDKIEMEEFKEKYQLLTT